METTLTTYSNTLPEKAAIQEKIALSASELEVVRLSKEGKLVKDYAPDALLKFIANLMYNAKLRLNHSTGFSDEANMQRMISLDLKRHFSGITDEEIKRAVQMGLNGDFSKKKDDVIIFSPANLTKWIKAYVESQKMPAMAKYINYSKSEEQTVPTLDQQLQNFKTALLYHVSKIRDTKDYYEFDFGNAFYDRLESLKILSVNLDYKWKIYNEEKEKLRANPEIKDKTEKSIFTDWVKNLAEKGMDTNNIFEIRLKSMCKRRILKEHVLEWIEAEVDLEEILDNAIANFNIKAS